LIKKSPLYIFVHGLTEYIAFLFTKELIEKTSRNKVLSAEENYQVMHGFYSSRSKRDNLPNHCNKGSLSKFGYRCDSDRKMTLEDEEGCQKRIDGRNKPQKKMVK
jgi:hypothetical protein